MLLYQRVGKIFGLVLAIVVASSACDRPTRPELPFETSNYTRTATYAEVIQVVDYVSITMANAHVDTMGYSVDGRMLPLVILSDRKITTPEEAHSLGRPLIFVMANIHAGEVEGKDAMMKLLLEFADGRHSDLLDKITVMIAPIYNADGNEDFARTNRTSQNGPDSVGVRPNRQGFDLNRDYMKLETPEAQALIGRAFNYWDPLLVMDLHTTNGSYHGYHLTYSTPLNPNTHPQIVSFQDRVMMPIIKESMSTKSWRIFEYGNFVRNEPDSGWATFSPQPRYGTNYYGLQNRLTLLSESYSYVAYKERIASTYDFVMATLAFCAEQAFQLNELRTQLNSAYEGYAAAAIDSLGTAFTFGEPVEEMFITGSVDTVYHEDIDRMTFRMLPDTGERMIRNFRSFVPTRYERVPAAYYIDNTGGKLDSVLMKLDLHGIAYEQVAEVPGGLQSFKVSTFTTATRAFQDRYINRVEGTWETLEVTTIEPGNIFRVPTGNRKRNLIFYLLEPTMDDGLVAWGFANARLANGVMLGILRE
jgi:murein tripeptide amidase MpaA